MKSKNDLLKIIGILSMIIDHVGYIFFPDIPIFRIIGRLAFPIFAFHIYIGTIYTQNFNRYILRLLAFALISQLPYTLAFQILTLNVLFTLLLAALLLRSIINKKWLVMILIITIAYFIDFDAGIYGIFIPSLFYITKDRPGLTILTWIFWTSLFIGYSHPYYQLYGIIAVILCLINKQFSFKIRITKWFFYIFYPSHLLILATLSVVIFSPIFNK